MFSPEKELSRSFKTEKVPLHSTMVQCTLTLKAVKTPFIMSGISTNVQMKSALVLVRGLLPSSEKFITRCTGTVKQKRDVHHTLHRHCQTEARSSSHAAPALSNKSADPATRCESDCVSVTKHVQANTSFCSANV